LQVLAEAGSRQPGRQESPVYLALVLEDGIAGVATYGGNMVAKLLTLKLYRDDSNLKDDISTTRKIILRNAPD